MHAGVKIVRVSQFLYLGVFVRTSFKWVLKATLASITALVISFSATSSSLAATETIEANNQNLLFNNTVKIGQNAMVGFSTRYTGVYSGVDALVTVIDVSNSILSNVDRVSTVNNWQLWTNAQIATGGGSVSYRVEFVKTGSREPVILKDFSVNVGDIDARQYVEFTSPSSYTLAQGTKLVVQPQASPVGAVRFAETNGTGASDDDTRFWAQVNYGSVSAVDVKLGATVGGSALYQVSFGSASWGGTAAEPEEPEIQDVAVNYVCNPPAPAICNVGGNISITSAKAGVSQTIKKNATIGNDVAFDLTDFAFNSWNTQPDGSGVSYDPDDTIIPTTNVTLYAIWEALPVPVTVTYYAPDASTGLLPDQTSAFVGDSYAVLGNTGSLARPGYTFDGWNTKPDGTGDAYVAGDEITLPSDVSLYAVWKAVPQVKVTYDKNDVNATGTYPTPDTFASGERYLIKDALNPVLTGKKFVGWSTNSASLTPEYAPGAAINPTSNLTLYAVWEAVPTKETVTYYDGGASSGTVPAQLVLNTVDTFTVAASGSLARPGFTFGGWTWLEDTANPKTIYQPGTSGVNPPADMSLEAVWVPEPTVTVSYDANAGGAESGSAPAATTVTYGARYLVEGAGTLELSGSKFLGWSTVKTSSTPEYAPGAAINPTTNVTLFAVWEALPVIIEATVTYFTTGSDSGTAPATVTDIAGFNHTISANTGSLSKVGYEFIGWNTDSNGEGNFYQPDEQIQVASDVNLYPVWRLIPVVPPDAPINIDVEPGDPIGGGEVDYVIPDQPGEPDCDPDKPGEAWSIVVTSLDSPNNSYEIDAGCTPPGGDIYGSTVLPQDIPEGVYEIVYESTSGEQIIRYFEVGPDGIFIGQSNTNPNHKLPDTGASANWFTQIGISALIAVLVVGGFATLMISLKRRQRANINKTEQSTTED